MKLFLTKIPFSLLFVCSAFLSSANYQESLSENDLAHVQANIDSIDVTMVDQQMNLKKLDQKHTSLDTSLDETKSRISMTDLLTILLSCLIVVYVVKADRINSLFGSSQGKKDSRQFSLNLGN